MTKGLDPKVCVAGAGLIGLTFALLCAEQGIPTAVIEANLPPQWPAHLSAGVTALNTHSLDLLRDLAIWPLTDSSCCGVFRSLQVWDALTGADIQFDSADLGKPYLGYNVDNASLVYTLWQRAAQHRFIRLLAPMKIDRLLQHPDQSMTLVLDSGEMLQPDALVGADGANSWLREYMQIDCQPTPYDHHALVTVVSTEKPHQEQGWQVFSPSGPLALLAMADRFQSAVVWSMSPAQAAAMVALDATAIAAKMNEVFGFRLGKIYLQTPARVVPLVRRHAKFYSKEGVVLIGDAAHTIHPLAGQGANLGFRDAQALAALMGNAFSKGRHLGHGSLFKRYERQRRADNQLMMSAMQFFQQSFGASDAAMVQLRKIGLRIFDRSPTMKRLCMQYALGEW